MKTMRQPCTLRLALDFSRPINPVQYERGRTLFAVMRDTLQKRFAAEPIHLDSEKGSPYLSTQ